MNFNIVKLRIDALAIWKFVSGYRWDIEYAKDSRISGVPALENWKEDPRYQI